MEEADLHTEVHGTPAAMAEERAQEWGMGAKSVEEQGLRAGDRGYKACRELTKLTIAEDIKPCLRIHDSCIGRSARPPLANIVLSLSYPLKLVRRHTWRILLLLL